MTRYVDSHHHFWDTAALTYEWLADEPRLGRRYALDDYRAATADDPPERFVFVEAGATADDAAAEARWVHEMCAGQPDFGGMVVWAPVHAGADAVARQLDALALATVKGVRRMLQSDPPGVGNQPGFVAGVVELGRRDLVFDLCVLPRHLDETIDLARSAPESRLVLDHFGKPDIAGGGLNAWEPKLRALAASDNVWCKLSGLVTEADLGQWTDDDLWPYVEVALDAFGAERILWGSDWPVCGLAATHREWRDATAELLTGLSASERDRIMAANAIEVYRLGEG